ncbi:hypothetical protein [Pontibacter ummariensis]|nr:hypothetical protein [Pontibacter ummariensis]
MKKVMLTAALVLGALQLQAQQRPVKKPSKEVLEYFAGSWSGEGEFASGKPISADLSFKASLDSSWIEYEHIDRAPNSYKATSWWGTDQQTGEFVAYIFDSLGGSRKFTGDGWRNGKLVLTNQQEHPQGGTMWQHFIYERLSEDSFKMTFELSKDGVNWRMVDYLVFDRAKGNRI